MLVLDPLTRAAALYRAGRAVVPAHSDVLGVTFQNVHGQLRLTWEEGEATV